MLNQDTQKSTVAPAITLVAAVLVESFSHLTFSQPSSFPMLTMGSTARSYFGSLQQVPEQRTACSSLTTLSVLKIL